ncbi:flagellar basal body P-ring formation chaperone FlgA [Devosia nitrariae]|uniref:Flagellar basal body P-ring biosynthesis protein FlgA n=1 Tax=Devosia nitrariae TaxID=2071872 RepID=A0ABQ5WB57_9HYPH|nr:flagellar basal body P-ring formation chaperone FlgA [Devosia nitrariae]GLQ57328.1 flagellar basal body P-ring biosynthesis protein FlgA [Devosia nitrariae]
MITRSLLCVGVAALMTGAALAEPALKADITVADAIVTAGDMFEGAGALADKPLFRAPRPGTVGTVALNDVAAAAARIGLTDYSTAGLTDVRVARAGVTVGSADFIGLIQSDLAARGVLSDGMSVAVTFSRDLAPLVAAATPEPVRLLALRHVPGRSAFSARFAVAGVDKPIEVAGTAELMIEMPHLAGSLPEGAVLGPDDIEMRPVPLRQADAMGYSSPNLLVGKALKRQSRQGMVLGPSDVAEPQVVGRNDMVTIYYRSGPMTLTVRGQALNAAAQGEPVEVLNLMSRRVIATTAIAAGAVEVTSGAIDLAGL